MLKSEFTSQTKNKILKSSEMVRGGQWEQDKYKKLDSE